MTEEIAQKFSNVLGFLKEDLGDCNVRLLYGDVDQEGKAFLYSNKDDYGFTKHGDIYFLPVSENSYDAYNTPLYGPPRMLSVGDENHAWVPSAQFARKVQRGTPYYSILPDDGILCHEGAHVAIKRRIETVAKHSEHLSLRLPEGEFSKKQVFEEALAHHVSYRYWARFHKGATLHSIREWMLTTEIEKTKHFYAFRLVLSGEPLLEEARAEILAKNSAQNSFI